MATANSCSGPAVADRLLVESLGASGDGVATGPNGGTIYVAGALPGETVSVEGAGQQARLIAIEDQSPDRTEPFCPYYDRCGGCVAQHIGPALYADWKRDKVLVALQRAGLSVAVEPLVDAHGQGRRRVTFHAREIDGATKVGFMERGSHHLVPIARCPITVPGLAGAAPAAERLARHLKRLRKPIDINITSTATGLDVDLRGSGPLDTARRQALIAEASELGLARLSLHGEVLVEPRRPTVRMKRAEVTLPPGSFLQATEAGEGVLAAAVLEGCSGARRVADLFAGSGPFTLRLAEAAEVHAVEADAKSLAALDRAARETPGLRRVSTEARDLYRRPLLPIELNRFDAIVLDPPRAGAEAQARQLILSSCRTVVMASCDPGTFARDAAILVGGGFSLDKVVPVDQFKWSAHLEMVGTFRRPNPRRRP